jgi:hypothetical protein
VKSLNIETKKSKNLFHPIYPIPASLWVLTSYGKVRNKMGIPSGRYGVRPIKKNARKNPM